MTADAPGTPRTPRRSVATITSLPMRRDEREIRRERIGVGARIFMIGAAGGAPRELSVLLQRDRAAKVGRRLELRPGRLSQGSRDHTANRLKTLVAAEGWMAAQMFF